MYTAHFQYNEGKSEPRKWEFEHFRNYSKSVREGGAKNCGRIQILAGDFNFQSATEQMNVASNL